jgi:phenylacetyl-CoA:acceptor oxidoreductase subunit 2
VGAIDKVRGTSPELQPYWDWRAAGNFIFGGAGAGLLAFAALCPPFSSQIFTFGAAGGLALIAAGLGCVFLELGRPMRALNVFLRPQTSWMSREAIVASLLFPLALLQIALGSMILALVSGIVAILFLYCQARLLKAARGIPAFREPAIVPLIFTTGLVEGGALLVLIVSAIGSAATLLIVLSAVGLAARFITWRAYRSHLSAPGAAPKAAVAALGAIDAPLAVVGHLMPLGFIAIALSVPPIARPCASLGAVLALGAGSFLKFVIITRASYAQGFAIPHSPARTHGYGRAGAKPGWT